MNYSNCLIKIFVLLSLFVGPIKSFSKDDGKALAAAKKLLIEKKRAQAIKLILKSDSLKVGDALRIAERFLTDQAQSEFETGESQRFTNSSDAVDSYKSSEDLEPDNISPNQGLILHYLATDQCSSAVTELGKIKEIFPAYPREKYFSALISRCEQAEVEMLSLDKAKDMHIEEHYLGLSNVYSLLARQQLAEARALIDKLQKEVPLLPELYWYSWRVQTELGRIEIDDLKKYIQMCKSSGESQKRMFQWDPYICQNLSKAEEELLKLQKN